MSLQLYRENGTYRRQQRSNSEWTKKNHRAHSQIYLCFWSRWTSCVWPSWLQLCFVCAANTELSASKPTEKHTHEAHHQHLKACKPHWIIAKDKNLPACPFQASPSKPLPTFYSVRQTLQIICKPIQFMFFFLTVRFKVLHHKLYCISKFFSPSPGCSAFMLTLYSLQNTWYAVVFFFLGLMTEKQQQQQLSTSLTFTYKERET